VTDLAAAGRPLAEVVEECVAAGVDVVQIRARELSGRNLLAHTEAVALAARRGAAARPGPVRVLVNRRVDVALAAGADGVHLGFDAMPVARARALLGPTAWIGVSTHAPEEVRAARDAGATHVHLAPIHAPISKRATRRALGTSAVAEAARHGIPILAQGGITVANAGDCLRAGAAGVAVTGTLLGASDPGEATRALRACLDASG
jgi:thiamine-phosphate diphosphorylase